jgi:polyphosphate kinase
VAKNSQVVNALVNAAQNGKWVFVSVELQARFDEKNNIKIAERLQEAGAQVVFGLPPMKVHCKLLLIQREGKQYAGLSTGNFNEATGRLYVDSVMLTANPDITSEVDEVFENLERASRMRIIEPPKFDQLLVSPFNLRRVLTRLIDDERAKGEDGYVFLKVNHLTDEKFINKIRRAADAGVKMDLIVRTTYAMLPHPNIRAISIVDRYLEHQRMYIFGKGADRKVFLGSADLMERNLDWRVEVAFPVLDTDIQEMVCEMARLQVEDDYKARIYDETQSNPYVGGMRGSRRAQSETRTYLEGLFKEVAGEDAVEIEPTPQRVHQGLA